MQESVLMSYFSGTGDPGLDDSRVTGCFGGGESPQKRVLSEPAPWMGGSPQSEA